MQPYHYLFILVTLFTLFISFPTSFSEITCECQDFPDDGKATPNADINFSHSSQSSSSSGSTDNNQGQESTDSNQGQESTDNSQSSQSSSSSGSTDDNNQGQESTDNSQSSQSSSSSGSTDDNNQGQESTDNSQSSQSSGSTDDNNQGQESTDNSQSSQGSSGSGSTDNNQEQDSTTQGNADATTTTTDVGGDSDSNLKGFFSKVFAFGDSFTAGGSLLFHGSASAVKTDQSQDHHQCIVDFLCQSLGLPPLPSFTKSAMANFQHGVNFATPGASALPRDELHQFTKFGKIAATFLNVTTQSFLYQINWFNDFLNQLGCKHKDNCKEEFDKALFWLGGMGIDDHARTVGTTFSFQWLKDKSVLHISTMLNELLRSGAKYVVVQGLPPLGCLLFEVSLSPHKHLNTLGCVVAVNAATMIHNNILQRKLEMFRGQYPDAKIVYGDIWSAFHNIIQNPVKFNFQETRKACCGTGGNLNFDANALCGSPGTTKCEDSSKYIFWDGIHLTAAMNKQLTHLILQQTSSQLIH